ncbi:hypothetical protein HN51_011086 [Arachis hypogaea]
MMETESKTWITLLVISQFLLQVLLGRATEGVLVDIDLGKGSYANKISRYQAIIKLDNDGSFYIKNFGKTSILVNNKEVQTGQSQRLHSNCLIEVLFC